MSRQLTRRSERIGQLAGQLAGLAGRHWLFLLFFVLGTALRAMVQLTYQPVLFAFFDSFAYFNHVYGPPPDSQRPLGYPIGFMRPLLLTGQVAVIPLVQHLLGLGMALAIYAMLVRRGVRGWLSALAVAPVLLDGYQLQIEQAIASDPLFQALVVAALVLMAWRRRPSPVVVACAGLLIGAAATVRFVGLPLLVVPLLYVLVVNPGWWRRVVAAGALVAPAVLPLLVYSSWTYAHTGDFRPGGDQMSARALHARVSPFADCGALAADGAPAYVVGICPDAPRSERPQSPKYYMRQTLLGKPDVDLPPGVDVNGARREFGRRVVLNQPVDMTKAVVDDFLRGFAWQRIRKPGEYSLEVWRFDAQVRPPKTDHKWAVLRKYGEEPTVNPSAGSFLRDYQSIVYTRGPMFAAGLIIPLLAAIGLGGARRSDLRTPALLVAGTCAMLLLTAAAFTFSWRYQLPSIPLLPWSAALGLAALFPGALRARPTNDVENTPDPENRPGEDADGGAHHGRERAEHHGLR
ncbi:MAG: hypothetical protein GEV03_08490 [Streptosporangiales bacterium]|nr:hypothetical protein [Streptosporangiales bacterium]